jgi:hypothetical protein
MISKRRWLHLLLIAGALVATVHAGTGLEVIAANERVFTIAILGGQNGLVQSRTLSMVHAAIHDALNTIDPRYERYALDGESVPDASAQAAIAAAVHDVLAGVIPAFGNAAQQAAARAATDADYAASLALLSDGPSKTDGMTVGRAAAAAVLSLRSDDAVTSANIPYTVLPGPGVWQPTPNPDPPSPPAAGLLPPILPGWGNVTPFAFRNGAQFRPDPPPVLDSAQYATDYNEVKTIGEQFSSTRTAEQSEIAQFWYEGAQAGWNRIARVVATQHGLDLWEQARLMALLNFAVADGYIAGWNAKYFYNFWRPVTAIRAGDTDGNPDTIADLAWNTYLNTPAIPDYPSTHSVLGGAASEVLARFFGDDNVAFVTTSGAPFAGITRQFSSFSQAAAENADSRVYAGIHFRTACQEGLRLGSKIGKFAFGHYLKSLS